MESFDVVIYWLFFFFACNFSDSQIGDTHQKLQLSEVGQKGEGL